MMDRQGATRRGSLVPTFGNARRCLPTNPPIKRNGHVMSSGSSSLTSTAHNNSSIAHNRGSKYSSSGCVRPSTAKPRPSTRPVAGHLVGSSRPVASKRPQTASTVRTNTSGIPTTTATNCSSNSTQGHAGDGVERAVRGCGVSAVARVWELKGLMEDVEGYARRLAVAYRAAGTAHKHPQEEALVMCERLVQANRSALSTLTSLLPQQHSPTYSLPPPPPQSSSTMLQSRTTASPLQPLTQRLSLERNGDSSSLTERAAPSTIASPRAGQPQGALVTHAMCAGEKEVDDGDDHVPTEEELSMILETELQSPPPSAAAAAATTSNPPSLHRPLNTASSQTTSPSNSASEADSRRAGDSGGSGVRHADTAAGGACPHSPVRERAPRRDPESPPSIADLQLSFATRKLILASAKKATAAAAANQNDNSPASPVLPASRPEPHTHTSDTVTDEGMTNAVDGVSTPQGTDRATLQSPVFRTGVKLRHPPTDARRTTTYSSSSSSCVSPPLFEPTIHTASALKLVAAVGTRPPYSTTTTVHHPHAPTPSCASFTSAAETPSLSALSLVNNAPHITVRARDGGRHITQSDDSTPRFASPLKTSFHQLNSVEKALMTADRGGQPSIAETPDTGEMRRGPVVLRFPGHANGSADRGSGSTPAVHRRSLDDSTLYPDITRHEMSFRYSLGAVDEEQPYELDVGAETEGLVVVPAAAAANAAGGAASSPLATPDGGYSARRTYAPHGQQPIITATTPSAYDDSFLDPLLESPLDASPLATATAGAAATATSSHVTTPPEHTVTNATYAGSTPYSVVKRPAEAAGTPPPTHAVSIDHDGDHNGSPGCTPLRRSARVRTPVKAYMPPEHTPRARQPRYIHQHQQQQPQQQHVEAAQHDSRMPLERQIHGHIEDEAGSHGQQQPPRRKSVRDRPPTPTPTRTRRSLLLDDVVDDDNDGSAEGNDGCGGGAVREGMDAGGGGEGKGHRDLTGQLRSEGGGDVRVRHAADGEEEGGDEVTVADTQHGDHTCTRRKGTPSSHKRRKSIRTTPSSTSRRRTSIASPSNPTDPRTQTRTRRRSSSSVKRGRRGTGSVMRGSPVSDSPLPRKSPRLLRKQVGGLLGGEGPGGNGAAQGCIGCGEVEGGGGVPGGKGNWSPLCPITEEEYARAPTFIKIQVTRDVLNEAIGKINGHSHKAKRLRPLQQDEMPGVLCMGDAVNRTVLLSLIHLKRVQIVMANDGTSKTYKTWK